MGATPDETTLSRVLPGTWTIAASNIPAWLSGERLEPRYSYELVARDPLVLAHGVSYETAEGEEKQIISQDSWDRGEFRGRGKGLQARVEHARVDLIKMCLLGDLRHHANLAEHLMLAGPKLFQSFEGRANFHAHSGEFLVIAFNGNLIPALFPGLFEAGHPGG